jgi:hypothetical protein
VKRATVLAVVAAFGAIRDGLKSADDHQFSLEDIDPDEDNTFALPDGPKIRKQLKREFKKQRAEVLAALPPHGGDVPEAFPPPLDDHSKPMAAALTPLLAEYWEKAGKVTLTALGLDSAEFRVVDPHVHDAIANLTLKFCASTNASTTRRLIHAKQATKAALVQGIIKKGESIPDLTKRIQKIFSGLNKHHAALIARTEASRAVHAASLMSAEESGVVEAKRWLASANSCDRCLALETKTKEAAAALSSAFAIAPGDSAYSTIPSPPLHPLCRCTITLVLTEQYRRAVEGRGGEAPKEVMPLAPPAAGAPKVKRAPKPETTPVIPEFPADPNRLEVVKKLGGSTGAELVRDEWGRQWVRKRGANADHLREEVLADEAYRRLGANVPKARLYEGAAGPVKLAEWIDGKTLADLSDDERKKAYKKLQKHFAADSLLGSWDVVGLGQDNVLVDKRGEVWRIDNGGSLRYRAQGGLKGPGWNDYPTELWTMRDHTKNATAAKAFAGLEWPEISGQIAGIKKTGAQLGLPAEVAKVYDARLAQMKDLAATSKTLEADKWRGDYQDLFAKHTLGIRAAGISAKMPSKLTQTYAGGVEVKDQDGNLWDHLRGHDSLVGKLHRYIEGAGGHARALSDYCSDQQCSSWSKKPLGLKALLASERSAPTSSYYWKPSRKAADAALEDWAKASGGLQKIREAVAAQHAFTSELLNKVDFAAKDSKTGAVRLIRTESKDVMKEAGLTRGDIDVKLKRGVAESTSVFRTVSVKGAEATVQDVPKHRVFMTYWQERYSGHNSTCFLSDGENEFIAILDDIPLNYVMPKTP